MSSPRTRAGAIAVMLAATLTGCGNTQGDAPNTLAGAVQQAIAQTIVGRRAEGDIAPAAPRTPQEMSAEALRLNPGPLVLVGLENEGRSQVMAMTGQNGTMRTYMTSNEQAAILRRGMLVGTRGLGNDMSVTEPQTEPLIRAGQSGRATRILRYYTGDGLETPLRFDCTTGPGPNPGVVIEDCRGHGISFQNNYLVQQGGDITVSRQWSGPVLGYLTIQTLRP